jgi:hypothetical protein
MAARAWGQWAAQSFSIFLQAASFLSIRLFHFHFIFFLLIIIHLVSHGYNVGWPRAGRWLNTSRS